MTNRIFGRPTALNRRDAMRLSLGGVVAGAGLLTRAPAFAQQKQYQWGSSSIGSTGYVIIEGFAAMANRHTDLRNASMATSGGTENMQLFHEGVIQFGQTVSTDWLLASQGVAPYQQPITVHQMFAYTVFNCTPIVRADSDIHTLEDLRGRRCMPSPAGGSTATMWRVLFEAAGILDDVEWTYGSWRETYDALRGDAVDCIPSLLTNGRPSPVMAELISTMPVRVLPISDDLLAKANEINPGIAPGTIPAGAGLGIEKDYLAASFSGVLGAGPDVPADDVYAVMRAIFDHVDEIHALGVQFQDVAADFGAKYLVKGFPIHKGAARFFREAGLWTDSMVEAG
jgi:TRAP transporter TAXI family solute receptor